MCRLRFQSCRPTPGGWTREVPLRNKLLSVGLSFALAFVLLAAGVGVAAEEDSWTGEIVEKACFVQRAAHGPDHAACAKRCFERGGDVALLTGDGELLILRAGDDAAPFEALKGMAGAKAKVTGEMGEDDGGYKVVVVTASESLTS